MVGMPSLQQFSKTKGKGMPAPKQGMMSPQPRADVPNVPGFAAGTSDVPSGIPPLKTPNYYATKVTDPLPNPTPLVATQTPQGSIDVGDTMKALRALPATVPSTIAGGAPVTGLSAPSVTDPYAGRQNWNLSQPATPEQIAANAQKNDAGGLPLHPMQYPVAPGQRQQMMGARSWPIMSLHQLQALSPYIPRQLSPTERAQGDIVHILRATRDAQVRGGATEQTANTEYQTALEQMLSGTFQGVNLLRKMQQQNQQPGGMMDPNEPF